MKLISLSSWCISSLVIGSLAFFETNPALAGRALGTDVSGHQTINLNWPAIRAAGNSFAWCKATEGMGFQDANFTTYMAQAKAAGIVIGPYHYARPDLNLDIAGADAEAHFFWSVIKPYVKNDGLTLLPMLDFEEPSANLSHYTKTTLSAWGNEWCADLVREAGSNGIVFAPIFYTYSSYATTWLNSTVTKWPLNMSTFPTTPAPQTGGPASISPWTTTWLNWQYADTHPTSGGDADVFAFDTNALMTVMVVGNIPPQSTNVDVGSNATFSITAHSTTTPTYKWFFNGVPIAGATAASYTVVNAQPSDAGAYSVIVSNTPNPFITTASLGVVSPPTNSPDSVLSPTSLVDFYPADRTPQDVFGTNGYIPYNNVTYVSGKRDTAFHFDGSTTYMSNNAATLAVPWTFCVWVNRQNSPTSTAAIVSDGAYELKLEQSSTSRSVGFTHFLVADYSFNYTVPLNTWTHLTFVGTSAGTTLYVNGALQSTVATSIPLPREFMGVGYLSLYARYVDYTLGSLDEIQIYNRALNATEINAIYSAGANGVVHAPEVTDAFSALDGTFHLVLRGLTGRNYFVHASSDLNIWTTVATIANTSGTNQYIDSLVGTTPQKFFRVSQ